MSYKPIYDPPGRDFIDRETGRLMRIIAPRAALAGWVAEMNLDGKWELVRRATTEDEEAAKAND